MLRALTAVVVLALPSAVAAARQSPVPMIAMPAAYEGATPGPLLAPAALDRWWRLFRDPDLDALEDEAFRAGPDALTAAARLREALATRRAQTTATWPGGSITGVASHEADYGITTPVGDISPTSGVTDTLSGNFNVSWELDLFGRLATTRRVAGADAAEARFNVEGSRASLAAAVADAYFQAKGLNIQLADARETVRIQTHLLDIARRKAAVGAGPASDVDQVSGGLSQAKAREVDLRAQLESVRRQLLILLGRGLAPSADLPLTGDPPELPPTPGALPAELLARRPDVREAEFRLRSELGSAHLRHLAVFPTLTLLPGLGLSRLSTPGTSYIPPTTLVTSQQTSTQGFWTLAANLNVPTLDIPKLLYAAHAEDARARETAIAYEKTVQTAYGEAQNALITLAAGEAATALLIDGEARAHSAYAAVQRRYAQGVDDLTAALNAEQSWRSVRTDLTSERVDTLRRAVRTYKALGGGWAFAPGPPQGSAG